MSCRALSSYYTVSGLSVSNHTAEEPSRAEGSRQALEGTPKETASAQ